MSKKNDTASNFPANAASVASEKNVAEQGAASAKYTILIVDDDRDIRYSLRRVLDGHGYEITEAASGEDALKIAPVLKPHVILLDNRMGGMSGIETLQHLRTVHPRAMTILMTAFGTTQTAIESMKYGAFDYIMKPFDIGRVLELVARAIQTLRDQAEAAKGEYKPLLNSAEYKEGIVGNSEAMQNVIKTTGRVAATNATVLITGESGTGKELVARCLHQHSLRSRAPFYAVNCAAIPEELIESELFGHEKGAFTGATAQKLGKFELCNTGTIFLDEIGDMSPPTQTKILRALQEGEIQRVGGTEVIKVDVRLVAATNKNLEEMVAAKTFREDLYYRLNVVRLRLPPLRERKEDIPLLVDFMFQRLAASRKTKARRISAEALAVLVAHDWPGNVRELENAIHRASVIAHSDTILASDLSPELLKTKPPAAAPVVPVAPPTPASAPAPTPAPEPEKKIARKKAPSVSGINLPPPTCAPEEIYDQLCRHLVHLKKTDALAEVESQLMIRLLDATHDNQSQVARFLGISRNLLAKRAEELG